MRTSAEITCACTTFLVRSRPERAPRLWQAGAIDRATQIETVRGGLTDARAEQLMRFWSSHGALDEEQGRRRLLEVICVLRDDAGEIVGANSACAARVPLIGNRKFWVYRCLLAPGFEDAAPAMLAAAFAALESEFDPAGDEPVGLCLAIADAAEIGRRPQAEWPDPRILYAGYSDARQIRIGYFAGARIGAGTGSVAERPHRPARRAGSERVWTREGDYRIEVFAEQDAIDEQAVIELWLRDGGLPLAEAQRRLPEVLLVATAPTGELCAVSTAYIQYNAQLRMELWYYRGIVAEAHRMSQIGVGLALLGRERLSRDFVTGRGPRAAGIIYEVEHEGLKRIYNGGAVWVASDFTFIGENERGDHVRVHYFPGALAPAPS